MPRQIIRPIRSGRTALVTPRELPAVAAWYSLDGRESDSTWLSNGAGRVTLLADRSGNSPLPALVLPGTSGQFAATPDSAALSITGDIDLQCWCSLNDWTPSASQVLLAKDKVSGGTRTFVFYVNTNGTLGINVSFDGSTISSYASTVAPTVADFGDLWVRATRVSASGVIKFWTSADGASWTQLGADVAGTAGALFDGTADLEIGAFDGATLYSTGRIYRARIYNGIAGTLAFDANFTTAAKLAANLTDAAGGATITLSSSGDLGARIHGARDLCQLTTGKMPLLSVGSDGRRIGTFDASNDFMRTAQFSLAQPDSITAALSVAGWTSGSYVLDGAAGANTAGVVMTSASPQLNLHAGSSVAANTSLPVATRGVLSAIFNGASSSLAVNRTAPTTGNAGAGTPNGITLGASGAGTAASFGNITFSELVVRGAADDTLPRQRLTAYEAPKWAVTL